MKVRMLAVITYIRPSENDAAQAEVHASDRIEDTEHMSWLDLAQEVGKRAQDTADNNGWELISITLTAIWS